MQNNEEGLEILHNKSGKWLLAPARPDAILVNTGLAFDRYAFDRCAPVTWKIDVFRRSSRKPVTSFSGGRTAVGSQRCTGEKNINPRTERKLVFC